MSFSQACRTRLRSNSVLLLRVCLVLDQCKDLINLIYFYANTLTDLIYEETFLSSDVDLGRGFAFSVNFACSVILRAEPTKISPGAKFLQ